MRIVTLTEDTKKDLLNSLLKRSPNNYGQYEDVVAEIIEKVKEEKDQALFDYTSQFDKCQITKDTIRVTEAEFEEALGEMDEEFLRVMKRSAKNIEDYHKSRNETAGLMQKRTGQSLDRKLPPLIQWESMFPEERQHILPPPL